MAIIIISIPSSTICFPDNDVIVMVIVHDRSSNTKGKGEWKRKKEMKIISRKSVSWSAVPEPCLSRLWLKLRGEQGSGPKGQNPSLKAQILAWRLSFGPQGQDLGLLAEILTLRLRFGPQD